MIRLGAISFINTIPIYSAYPADPEVQLIYDVPARLNARLLNGELDISPISSACYLRNQSELVLLDDLSVSSPGAVESVLFFSSVPWGSAMQKLPVISVPNDSETSVALLSHLLKDILDIEDPTTRFKIYEAGQYEKALAETGNALVIGDHALLAYHQSKYQKYCYDLSSLWFKKTNLPFVFAVWAARKEWANQYPEKLQKITHDLQKARERFFNESTVFEAGVHLAGERSHLPANILTHYYRHCLSYGLNTRHQEGLQEFQAVL